MKIKICGITNIEDALDAVSAGAHALGFVFYDKSPRYITPQDALKIIKVLPPFIKMVGLFVNETPKKINEISKISKIDLAQIINENSTKEYFNLIEINYIQVIRAKSKHDILEYKNEYILIDAFVESFGGSGKRVELKWFENIECSKIILAGGLDSNNVQELKKYNFYGVDVSSGVEIRKGKKDKTKMTNFIKAVNEI